MRQTISQLLSHANKNIHLYEAEILLARALKKSKEHIIAHPEINVGFFNSRKYKLLVKKRQKGTPIAYLTGHKEFYGLDFLVNKYTLIPRPDTETLVNEVISQKSTVPAGRQEVISHPIILIDIGTGSGCIPISIIKTSKHQNIKTIGVDISQKALQVARKNAQKHNVNINFLHGSLLQPIQNSKFKIQNSRIIITANLPYLTKEQFEQEKSIQHEPKSALVANEQGLALYKELLNQIKSYVSCFMFHVSCFFEIDPTQSKKIKALINKILPNAIIEIKKDLSGHDRLIIINLN